MSVKAQVMLRYFEMTLLQLDKTFINRNLDTIRLLAHMLDVDPFFYYVATNGDTMLIDHRETYDPYAVVTDEFLNSLEKYTQKKVCKE